MGHSPGDAGLWLPRNGCAKLVCVIKGRMSTVALGVAGQESPWPCPHGRHWPASPCVHREPELWGELAVSGSLGGPGAPAALSLTYIHRPL